MKIDGTRSHDRATEQVLAYYAACNRGDHAAMLDCLAENVIHDRDQGARESGREAYAAFLRLSEASCREQLRDIVVMASPDGARAAAEYVVHGEYLADAAGMPPANGQRYVLPGGAFFEFRGQKIVRVTDYRNLQDWLRQIG